jgi:hypothetical protein
MTNAITVTNVTKSENCLVHGNGQATLSGDTKNPRLISIRGGYAKCLGQD